MSCIAGVGGDVTSLVKVAQSGWEIIAIGGCSLHCAKKRLARHKVEPSIHLTLTREGFKKQYHQDYDPEDVENILLRLRRLIRKMNEELEACLQAA